MIRMNPCLDAFFFALIRSGQGYQDSLAVCAIYPGPLNCRTRSNFKELGSPAAGGSQARKAQTKSGHPLKDFYHLYILYIYYI